MILDTLIDIVGSNTGNPWIKRVNLKTGDIKLFSFPT